MRPAPAVLALGMCLLATACGAKPEPAPVAAQAPAAVAESVVPSPSAAAVPSPTPATSSPATRPRTTTRPAKTSSPAKRSPSPKPVTGGTKADPNAACDAAFKADDRLLAINEVNGPAVGSTATPAEVTAAVAALRAGYQANVKAVRSARGLTSDADVRTALANLITARTAVIARLNAAGADAKKKNSALFTAAEATASANLWRYPDGVCAAYVD